MTPKLFTPLTLGGKKDPVQLQHRVVMAPLTRLRASEDGVQIPLAADVSATPLGRKLYETPRALELEEIPAIIEDYLQAALNAIEAGFDGVELHAANGYLLEQFLWDGVNKRTDKYGGSIENRARLIFEVLDAITSAVPQSKVSIRLAPFNLMFGCVDSTPIETYGYVIKKLNEYDLSYLHLIEPRGFHATSDKVPECGATVLFRPMYDGVLITCGGFDRKKAVVDEGNADAVAVGRSFISNPDLVTVRAGSANC